MRKKYAIRPIDSCSTLSPTSLTITLLNTRSLMKHAVDIAADEVIKNSDIIFLTETKVESTTDIGSISDILDEFIVLHNISTEHFCSLTCCYKNTINNIQQQNDVPSFTLYSTLKKNFQHICLRIVFVLQTHVTFFENNSFCVHFFPIKVYIF